MNENNNENLVYEIGYHFLPTVEESDVLAQLSGLKAVIEENDGVILAEDMPKMITLAYDISKDIDAKKQKFNRAYFGWIKFEMETTKIGELKNKVDNNPNILRFLIVKTVKENTLHTPKAAIFKRENNKEDKTEENIEKPKLTEAEMDKSIDELLVNEK